MGNLDDSLRIGSRRWIAWKLVQLAHRIYDASFYERITIRNKVSGDLVMEYEIGADMYGGGVMCAIGNDEFGGYTATWDEFTPDWSDA